MVMALPGLVRCAACALHAGAARSAARQRPLRPPRVLVRRAYHKLVLYGQVVRPPQPAAAAGTSEGGYEFVVATSESAGVLEGQLMLRRCLWNVRAPAHLSPTNGSATDGPLKLGSHVMVEGELQADASGHPFSAELGEIPNAAPNSTETVAGVAFCVEAAALRESAVDLPTPTAVELPDFGSIETDREAPPSLHLLRTIGGGAEINPNHTVISNAARRLVDAGVTEALWHIERDKRQRIVDAEDAAAAAARAKRAEAEVAAARTGREQETGGGGEAKLGGGGIADDHFESAGAADGANADGAEAEADERGVGWGSDDVLSEETPITVPAWRHGVIEGRNLLDGDLEPSSFEVLSKTTKFTKKGASDAVASDAVASDAGASDAGASDAGASDAGASDAGALDAGASDAAQPRDGESGDAQTGHG